MNRYLRKCGRDRDFVITSHATSRHSRAHGNPFIHTRQMSRLETHSPQPTTTWSETDNNTGNKAVIPSNNTRCTMDPRLREDDEK